MLAPEVRAEIPAFTAKKAAQWERVKDALPGLQLAITGEGGNQAMLTYSPHDESFYESIIFGQLPHLWLEEYGSSLNPMYRDADDTKKPFSHQRADMTDAQIDAVIALWRTKQSALSLDFVPYVYVHGKLKTRPPSP
jgi:hypothetical protein